MPTPALLLKTAHLLRLRDDTFAGTITLSGAAYPANIGAFRESQQLSADGGGFTRVLLSKVVVSKADLPSGYVFKSEQELTVTPPKSAARNCRVDFVEDLQTHWNLTVKDRKQGF